MVAPNPSNRGSVKVGIWEASSILTTRYPPRTPSTAVKYADSGLRSSSMDAIVSPIRPSLINESPLSGWMVNESRTRILSPLLAFNPLHDATLRSPAHLFRVRLGADCLYSPECVGGEFSEVRLNGVLRSSFSPSTS